MDAVVSSNAIEYYLVKKAMDTQIGAFNAARSKSTRGVNMQATGLRHLDPETDFKVQRIASKVNESIHLAANEPSLGLFRIQEHVCRTLPNLVQRKSEVKVNAVQIEEAVYDLNLSMNVIESISKIKNFTRIQEALKTAIKMKRELNLVEEQEAARQELDSKNAQHANRSISQNEPAEGYICPVCYFALTSQDELISHWQKSHSLQNYDNEVFQEVELPSEVTSAENAFVVNDDNDMTVIDMPGRSHISECEDVVRGFRESSGMITERSDVDASDGSDDIEEAHVVANKL